MGGISKYEQRWWDEQTRQGRVCKYHPCWFQLKGTKFMPDFYCYEDDCYYEITTTHRQDEKVKMMQEIYPHINIKVVHIPLDKIENQCKLIINMPRELRKNVKILAIQQGVGMNELIVTTLQDKNKEGK